MYTQVEKKKENKSRAVANSFVQKKSVKPGVGFVDNRSEVIAQRKLQEIINSSSQTTKNLTIQKMGAREEEEITNWIRMYASQYLSDVRPDLITDAEQSSAVRLRWFNLKIQGTGYKVGLNIHYGGTVIGGVWITNLRTNETLTFHPYRDPQHHFGSDLLSKLRLHVYEKNPLLGTKIEPPSLVINDTGEGNKFIGNDML